MKFLSKLNKKNLEGKVALVRVDLNIEGVELRGGDVPLRIVAILPTIKFLTERGAKVVLMSHRGRPMSNEKKFSLKLFAAILGKLLGEKVQFIPLENSGNYLNQASAIIGNEAKVFPKVFLLENLRFFEGEEKNDEKFAKQLAGLGDIYINDAFAVCHRRAASVVAITKFLPSYVGLSLEKEIKNISAIMKSQRHPFVIILGGAKISDKICLIENFLPVGKRCADYFLIGGGIANTFFAAQELPIGDSLYEKSMVSFAKKMLNNKKVILPVDSLRSRNRILDIGPNTIDFYSNIIKKAKMIIWNGPMGYFENPRFANGSESIARAILRNKKSLSVVGGGETTSLFQNSKTKNPGLFISTGGGAMLEYLAGEKLPGIESLN